MSTKIAWEPNTGPPHHLPYRNICSCTSVPKVMKTEKGMTDHLIGTSAQAPQCPMVMYTEMGIVGLDLHGLLCH
ncbi:hypothetical protein TNCV_2365271 [Trichonephila clavipes]|nr:hypothetical protein TNCV_2365271 [Trichonephila clavipes]